MLNTDRTSHTYHRHMPSAASLDRVGEPVLSGWKTTGHAIGFWLLAAMGIVVTTGAWFWLAIVGLEETTEQPKALASGTTMTGTALFFGVVPLVAVHLVGFAILMSYGASRRHNRQSGLWLGAGATIAASSIGLTVLLLFLYA